MNRNNSNQSGNNRNIVTSSNGSGGGGGNSGGGNNVNTIRREYDIGNTHVQESVTRNPNGFTQTTKTTTSRDGNMSSSYSSSTSFSSVGGVNGGSSPFSPLGMMQNSMQQFINRPNSFLDSNFNGTFDHPAFPGFRAPHNQLSSRNGQPRAYVEEIDDDDTTGSNQQRTTPTNIHNVDDSDNQMFDSEDAEFQEAIRLSMESQKQEQQQQKQQSQQQQSRNITQESIPNNEDFIDIDDIDEEELEFQKALNESVKLQQQQQQQNRNNNQNGNNGNNNQNNGNNRKTQSTPPQHQKPKKKVKVRQDLNQYFHDDGKISYHDSEEDDEQRRQEQEEDDALQEIYNNPELRGYLSPNERDRQERNKAINESRRIREEQEREFNESLKRDQQKQEEEMERKEMEEAIALSIELEKQDKLQTRKSHLPTVDVSTLTPDQLKSMGATICEITICVPPDGKRITCKFLSTNTLQLVRDWIDVYMIEKQIKEEEEQLKQDTNFKSQPYNDNYQLVTNFPRQILSDNSKTLMELQLCPRSILNMVIP